MDRDKLRRQGAYNEGMDSKYAPKRSVAEEFATRCQAVLVDAERGLVYFVAQKGEKDGAEKGLRRKEKRKAQAQAEVVAAEDTYRELKALDPVTECMNAARVATSASYVLWDEVHNTTRASRSTGDLSPIVAFKRQCEAASDKVASLIAVVFAIGFFWSKVTGIKQESLAQHNEKLEPL